MLPYDASKKITLRAKTIGKGQPSPSKKEQEVEKILIMEGNRLFYYQALFPLLNIGQTLK